MDFITALLMTVLLIFIVFVVPSSSIRAVLLAKVSMPVAIITVMSTVAFTLQYFV